MSRWARRKDLSHPAIVAALRAAGAVVLALDVKDGPDLVVGFRGRTFLFEAKRPKARETHKNAKGATVGNGSRGGQLSPGQMAWHARWTGGPLHTVRTPEEALALVGALHASGNGPPRDADATGAPRDPGTQGRPLPVRLNADSTESAYPAVREAEDALGGGGET